MGTSHSGGNSTVTHARKTLALALVPIALAAGVALAACSDGSDALLRGSGPDTNTTRPADAGPISQQAQAEQYFRDLQPELEKSCGGICHGLGTAGGSPPKWLAGPDPYLSIKQSAGMVTAEPANSRLVNKGAHAGPALEGDLQALRDKVTRWLVSEAVVLRSVESLAGTDPFVVTEGLNTIDISKGGKGIDGAKITFTATATGKILTLFNMLVVAPPSTGLSMSHPVFATVSAQGVMRPDPIDSFSNVELKVSAGQSQQLGPGSLILTSWDAAFKLRILFTKLEPVTVVVPDGGGGGCKSVATFTSSAVPAFQGNTCLNCHRGQNGNATAALDLAQINTSNATACAQVLNKVNLANKAQSPIILAATGGQQHPFTIADPNAQQAFRTAILGWLNNE